MSECSASSFFMSYEAAESCRPVVERENRQPYVAELASSEVNSLGWLRNIPPRSNDFSQSFFFELNPVSWCYDNAEFTFPLGFNIANAKRCCEMLENITKQTCEVEVVPRSWLAIAARVRLK